jgi:hypothetical protein
VPLDINRWELTDPGDVELYGKEARAIQRAWKFLEPFFASRGYTLYQSQPSAIFTLLPAPSPPGPKAHTEPSYPFARRVFKEDKEIEFYFMVSIILHIFIHTPENLLQICSHYACGLPETPQEGML